MSLPSDVALRDVVASDLPIFYEHQRDPEATRMAAFAARDREASTRTGPRSSPTGP